MDNPNQPGSTPERPADETPASSDVTPSSGQPTERVTPYTPESQPETDLSQLTMPQPETTIYTPQPGVPPAYTQPMGAPPPEQSYTPPPPPQPQQPYMGEQARAPQQPAGETYQQPTPQQGYPQQPYPQGQYQQGQYPPGQYPPQGQYPQQYPPQYQQGNVPPGYPPPGYAQPAQPLPKKGGVPVIVWVIGGSVLAVLIVCGLLAFMISQAVNNVTRGATDAFATVEASVGGWQGSFFYNSLDLGDYDNARNFLSADLKKDYPASRLQQEWERLVDEAGGITIGESGPGSSNNTWVQKLEGNGNNKTYTIRLIVGEAGSDFLIVGANPSLIPEP